jgi:hypothetical protein
MTSPSSSPLASAVLATALVLSSCATSSGISESGAESISAAADAMADAISAEAEDAIPLRSGIESFLLFIARERGPEAAGAIAAMRRPEELTAFLASRYGYTAYEEALSAYAYWSKHPKGPRWDAKAALRLETEHFVIVTMPGTAAHADRDYLARLLERQVVNVGALINPNEAMRANFERNLATIKGRKVEVILPPDPRSLKSFGSTAVTSYGLTFQDSQMAVIASIVLPYYNALSSAVLAHEVTHVLDIFFKLDARSAPPLPASDASAKARKEAIDAFTAWAKPTFTTIIPSDKGFGEGFAEYAATRFSPLHRAFFADPDKLLGVMEKRVPPLDDVLARSPTTKDRMIRIVRYTELNSLVTYLVDRYGLERFLDFYMSVPLAESRFIEVFGKGYKAMQAEWRASTRR